MWGKTIYVITAPADVTATYRNPNLGFDGHLYAVLSRFRFSDDGLRRSWNT